MCKKIFLALLMIVSLMGFTFAATKTPAKKDTKTTTQKPKTETKTEVKQETKTTSSTNFNTYFKPGTFAINLGIGFAFFWGGFDIYPGVEYTFYQFRIADKVPFDIGVAVRGVYYTWSYNYLGVSAGFTYFGAGVFGTLHFTPKVFPNLPEFLSRTDVYIGVGVKFFAEYFTGDAAYLNSLGYSYGGFGIATMGGVSYFITDNFAINFEGSYYGYGGGLFGILYKF